jgi:hypothetical protein
VDTGKQSNAYPDSRSGASDELRDAMPRPRPRRLPDDDPSPEQIELYRRMTPGRRLEIAEQLYWSARSLKAAWVRSLNPTWTEEQVETEVKHIFSNARS